MTSLLAPQREGAAPIIVLSAVNYRYRGAKTPALSDVDLSVPRGSCFGLLGLNGAGKSTLISLLTGALAPQDGEMEIGGFCARKHMSGIRPLGAVAPQDLAFYPTLTGHENLTYFAGLYRMGGKELTARLSGSVEICGLQDVLARPAATYSGGLKRRLNLAIALLNDPEILYLDEPTVGVDVQSRQCIINAIQILRARGTTIVYTSHYMEEVETICDELAVIDRGRVVARGATTDLLRQDKGRTLHVTLETLPAVPPDLAPLKALWLDDRRIEIADVNEVELTEALAALRRSGASIGQIRYGVSRLQEIYDALVEERAAA